MCDLIESKVREWQFFCGCKSVTLTYNMSTCKSATLSKRITPLRCKHSHRSLNALHSNTVRVTPLPLYVELPHVPALHCTKHYTRRTPCRWASDKIRSERQIKQTIIIWLRHLSNFLYNSSPSLLTTGTHDNGWSLLKQLAQPPTPSRIDTRACFSFEST